MSRLTRDGTTEPVSRDHVFRRERGQEIFIFLVQLAPSRIGKLYPVDPYSCYMCDHTTGSSPPLAVRECSTLDPEEITQTQPGAGSRRFAEHFPVRRAYVQHVGTHDNLLRGGVGGKHGATRGVMINVQ